MSAGVELTDGRFRSMGSECRIVTDLGSRGVRFALARLEELEARWSRFRVDSEISHCNLRAGEWVEVSSDTLELVERAVSAFERTNGRFHPLMLRELVAVGYDRSHDELEPPTGGSIDPTGPRRPPVAESISIDGSSVRIPPGAAFDPSGIGKGLAADLVVGELVDAGASWALLSIGGDLRLGGSAIVKRGWEIEVPNPWSPGTTWATARMHGGGLATSSTYSRRWSRGDDDAHHLLDARTGRPAASRRVAATAHAGEAWWADVVAKCAVIDADLDTATIAEWDAVAVAFLDGGGVEVLGWEAETGFAVAS